MLNYYYYSLTQFILHSRDTPFWTVDTLYYTEINEELVSPYYLYRYLRLLDMSRLDSGTGVPSMTFDSYYNINVFLPNIEEQRRVASILQKIDAKIALNHQINDNLPTLDRSLTMARARHAA